MSGNKLLTIVTITFNRQKELVGLYNSLRHQTSYNFKWLVLDDGSNDKTVDYIIKVKREAPFQVKLIKNKNIGKYKEMNKVFPIIDTELLLFLDSDDYLIDDGVEMIQEKWEQYQNDSNIGSLIFECGNGNDKDPFHKISQEIISHRYYYLIKNKQYGDYSDVFVTKHIKSYRFPEFSGEKFMSEGPLYYWLSQKYKSIFIPNILTIGAYQTGGLTRNIRKNQINNYQGTLYETNLYLNQDTPFLFRIKKAILFNYVTLKSPQNYRKVFLHSEHKFLLCISLLPAYLLSLKKIDVS